MNEIRARGDVDSAELILPKATVLSLARAVRGEDVESVTLRVGHIEGRTVVMVTINSADMRGEEMRREMVATASGVFDL